MSSDTSTKNSAGSICSVSVYRNCASEAEYLQWADWVRELLKQNTFEVSDETT